MQRLLPAKHHARCFAKVARFLFLAYKERTKAQGSEETSSRPNQQPRRGCARVVWFQLPALNHSVISNRGVCVCVCVCVGMCSCICMCMYVSTVCLCLYVYICAPVGNIYFNRSSLPL